MSNSSDYQLNLQFEKMQLEGLLKNFRRNVVRQKDKSLADHLEEQLLRRVPPDIDPKTFLQLAKWCKTDGIYQNGMEVARKISLLLFGRVLDRSQLGV